MAHATGQVPEVPKPVFRLEMEPGSEWNKEATKVLANLTEEIFWLKDRLKKEIQNRKFGQQDIRRRIDELTGTPKRSGTDPERMNLTREIHLPTGYVLLKSYLDKNLPESQKSAYPNSVTALVKMKFFPSAKRLFGEETKSPWIAKMEEVENFIQDRIAEPRRG